MCTFASEKFARGQFHPSKVANTSLARLNLTPEIRRYLFRKKFFFLKLGKDQNFFNQVSGNQIFGGFETGSMWVRYVQGI